MAESFKFSVGIIGESSSQKRIGNARTEISLNDAIKRISNLPVSDEDKKLLSGLVKKVPHGGIRNFLSNYSNHLKKH
jgi:hypothetical protein